MWEQPGQPCHIHAYTVYTPIGGKGRCHTSCDLQDHSTQARKSAGEISTLDLKPMRKDTQSPKQEQSMAPQNGPWSKQKFKKKKRKKKIFLSREGRSDSVNFPFWTMKNKLHEEFSLLCVISAIAMDLMDANLAWQYLIAWIFPLPVNFVLCLPFPILMWNVAYLSQPDK